MVQSSDRESVDPERTVDADATLLPEDSAAARRQPPSELPTHLRHYVLLERLGAGAMGIVLAAYDPKLDRRVAIKLLKAEGSDRTRRRLVREAQALAQVSHPNIVQIYEIGEPDLERGEFEARGFIVMEYVDGVTLTQWLRQRARSITEIIEVLRQAGEGLAAAHAEGMIHRDFKPDNVMVRRDGRVVVMDFGLARGALVDSMEQSGEAKRASPSETSGRMRSSSELSQVLTATGAILGTPAYMAPEIFIGSEADARVDQFSFCVTLWEALHGKRPFTGASLAELTFAVTTGEFTDPSRGEVPGWLHAVVVRGLEVDPQERWPSMRALLDALDADPTRKRRAALVAGGIVGVVALGALALTWYRGHQRDVAIADCQAQGQAIDTHWNDDVRQRFREDFVAAGAGADSVWEHTVPVMDQYAADWAELRTSTCLGAHVEGVLAEPTAALIVACLHERQQTFAGIIDAWSQLDGAAVTRATMAAHHLPPLEACTDELALALRKPPPAELSAAVAELRARLERSSGLRLAGRYQAAMDETKAIEAEVEALQWQPLHAEVLIEKGLILDGMGKYEDARIATEKALYTAVAGGHDIAVFDAAAGLTSIVGWELSQHEQGERWYQLAKSFVERLSLQQSAREATLIERNGRLLFARGKDAESLEQSYLALEIRERVFGPESVAVANTLNNIGIALWQQGKYDEALGFLRRSLALRERAFGDTHPSVSGSLNNIGLVLWDSGRYDEAEQAHGRALTIRRAVLEPGHVDTASSHNNLGLVQWNQGKLDQAIESFSVALEMWQAELGPRHPDVAMAYNNVGLVRREQGQFEAALTALRRAQEIRTEVYGPEHAEVALTTNNIGLVLESMEREDEALAAFEQALAVQRRVLEEGHPDIGQTLGNIGAILLRRGDVAEAREHLDRALAIREAALGPEHPAVALSLHASATLAHQEGKLEQARRWLVRAIAIRVGAGVDSTAIAQSELLLGTVLSELGDPVAARATVESAHRRLGAEGGTEALRAELDAWLRDH